MVFYFAVSDEMLQANCGLGKQGSKEFNYKLNYNSYLFFTITKTAGECWDKIKKYQKEYNCSQSFSICEAKLENNDDFIVILSCMLSGDNNSNLEVVVTDITYFKENK